MPRITLPKLRFWLFTALLVTAPFSKYPSVPMPAFNFTSFRIGLYPLLIVLFVFLCLPWVLGSLPKLLKSARRSTIATLVLLGVVTLGFIPAISKGRSMLLILSIGLLLSLTASACWYVAYGLPKHQYKPILKAVLIAGISFGIFSILQFVLAGFVHQNLGLLCRGCTSQVFGFPRISGFAAEPQFHANAMMIYFFIGLGAFYHFRSRLALWSTALSAVAIGLTFSRGAYLASVTGCILFLVIVHSQGVEHRFLNLKRVGVVAAGFLAVLILMVGASSYHYRGTPDIAYKTFRSMVQQLSLGVINLPAHNGAAGFQPAGLVQASGNDRLSAAKLGLQAWHHNVYTTLFGVGAGNLGPFVVAHINSSVPNNLTVYIHYVLVIAELGLVGLLAFLSIFAAPLPGFFKKFWRDKDALIFMALGCLMVAFLIQYGFFGSYINVPYVWLFGGIIIGLNVTAQRKGAIMYKPHEE